MSSAPPHFFLPRQPRRALPNSPLRENAAPQPSTAFAGCAPGDLRRPRPAFAPGNRSSAHRPTSSVRDSGSDYNDLYDVSDDESALVPIKVSNSVKQYLSRNDLRRESLPSLVIPSPTAWPTIEKLQKAKWGSKSAPMISKMPQSSPQMPLSPAALAKLGVIASLRVPAANATPSLDGSLGSDEIASMSPSTPDLRSLLQDDGWEMPMQLNAQAMATLQHLSPDFNADLGPIVEVPETPPGEMQERGLNIHLLAPPPQQSNPLPQSEPVSAISLPSPGGFLASLPALARQAWALPEPTRSAEPTTATAEGFYDIPWVPRPANVVERTVELGRENNSDGPPTARQEDFPHKSDQTMIVKARACEYDEEYEKKLYETAAHSKNRTSMWLSAQETYLSALKDNNPANAEEPSPRLSQAETLSPSSSPDLVAKSPSTSGVEGTLASQKKAVRFAENAAKTPVTAVHDLTEGRSDPLFYHAFQHLVYGSRPSDAFDLAQIRADALQAQRLYLSHDHWQQLQGSYRLSSPKKPEKDFAHLPSAPSDPNVQKQREAIARADRERQALSQLSLAHWHLEASRMLSGGSLLSRSVRESIDRARKAGRTPRVLDLGGIPVGDWGWAVALQERDAKVYTAIVSDNQTANGAEPRPRQRGPSNHRVKNVANPWTLPFPTGSVDVVSARSLHALCRTRKPSLDAIISPHGDFEFPFAAGLSAHPRATANDGGSSRANDEYAATLAEIRRILAPGGVFHYHLLDAEMSGTTSTLQARSVEFAVALRAQGFDSAAGHHSHRRLHDAGFAVDHINENWVELPVGGASPGGADIANVTELVGAVAWERWMLATRGEAPMRAVAQALETARKADTKLSWKLLVGVARR